MNRITVSSTEQVDEVVHTYRTDGRYFEDIYHGPAAQVEAAANARREQLDSYSSPSVRFERFEDGTAMAVVKHYSVD